MKKPLTEKQQKIYDYIVEYYIIHFRTPKYENIMDNFGYKSKRNVSQYKEQLYKKGYVDQYFVPIALYGINNDPILAIEQLIRKIVKEELGKI